MAGGPEAGAPRPAPAVEQALGGPAERRTPGWRSHVTVVPGGRGPGRPDHDKQARARAVLPLAGPRLVMVLGCTVGAGQTVTTLMLADLLASLRGEPVAALDMNPGPASLTELARVPATMASALLAMRASAGHPAHAAPSARKTARGSRTAAGGLDVICDDLATAEAAAAGPSPAGASAGPPSGSGPPAGGPSGGSPAGGRSAAGGSATGPAAAGRPAGSRWAAGRAPGAAVRSGRLLDVLASRYALTLADPGAAAVARVLPAADGLVLVAPASPDAARAVGMTLEWLGAHSHEGLRAQSVAVLNGVSKRSVQDAEQAELVLRGRCRAIVRVPWDDHLAEPHHERGIRESLAAPGPSSRMEQLRPAVFQAYTALAGVLVATLAAPRSRGRAAR